jgi:hypothetical protein
VYFSSFTAVETNQNPDYIIDDDTHENTGLIVRKIYIKETDEHTFIVLRICTDSQNGQLANSIISGWKTSIYLCISLMLLQKAFCSSSLTVH